MKYSNRKADTTVMLFAKIIEGLLIKNPYINHNATPVKNIKNMVKDNPETFFERQVL